MGLRFDRMISEEMAVYDVIAGNSTVPAPLISPFSESEVIGQLAVMAAPEHSWPTCLVQSVVNDGTNV